MDLPKGRGGRGQPFLSRWFRIAALRPRLLQQSMRPACADLPHSAASPLSFPPPLGPASFSRDSTLDVTAPCVVFGRYAEVDCGMNPKLCAERLGARKEKLRVRGTRPQPLASRRGFLSSCVQSNPFYPPSIPSLLPPLRQNGFHDMECASTYTLPPPSTPLPENERRRRGQIRSSSLQSDYPSRTPSTPLLPPPPFYPPSTNSDLPFTRFYPLFRMYPKPPPLREHPSR